MDLEDIPCHCRLLLPLPLRSHLAKSVTLE
jgi:hypothetical protein